MNIVMLRSLGKHIPEDRRSKPNQIKGRTGANMLTLLVIEGIHIVLTTRLLILLKLAAHKQLGLLHSHQAEGHDRSIKVNDLHQVSERRNLVDLSTMLVEEELIVRLDVHHIVAVEIVMNKSIVPLSKRKSKDNL